ncbi:MAG: DUF1566 domain-containing protein [Magnetococcales bacterium]|nr:DUF1566 domain-containing protein [Magnetococcales bacterium]
MKQRDFLVYLLGLFFLIVPVFPAFATTFEDAPESHWAYSKIEVFSETGITSGCDASNYCPDSTLQRSEIAIFLLRAKYGSNHSPPAQSGDVFEDVVDGYWAGSWIEEFASLGITSGCDASNYCPSREITRAEMAVFLLRTLYGSDYSPPDATGTAFADISADYWAATYIEKLESDGLVSGTTEPGRCDDSFFCPSFTLTRAEMAVFLVRAFELSTSENDSDGDGVDDDADAFPNDYTETQDTDNDGTGNYADSDDDGDGLPDTFEAQYGLDPLDENDAAVDADGDGASNLAEYQAGTDPTVDDTYPAPVPATGQEVAHQDGDDGDLQPGTAWPDPRFTDNGDTTVTDNLTGLIWMQNANCWGSTDWYEALVLVARLNSGSESCDGYGGGHADWRLPSLLELESLLDMAEYGPALPADHPFTAAQSSLYWSGTTGVDDTSAAWYVFFRSGYIHTLGKSSSLNVWPVRGETDPDALAPVPRTGQTTSYAVGDDGDLQTGLAWPEPRFADNGDGSITDNMTGLIWMENANCWGSYDWYDSLNLVAGLNAGTESCDGYGGGHDDWRLPTRRELQSLADRERHTPPLPAGHPFHGITGDGFCSSTTYANFSNETWHVHLNNNGSVHTNAKITNYYVWPVRGGR